MLDANCCSAWLPPQISCATEVPAFQLESTLQRKVSVPVMITIALLATSLRLAYIALLPVLGSPWAVLPVELLQGVTFACGWGAATVQAGRLAPQGLEATVQVSRQSMNIIQCTFMVGYRCGSCLYDSMVDVGSGVWGGCTHIAPHASEYTVMALSSPARIPSCVHLEDDVTLSALFVLHRA